MRRGHGIGQATFKLKCWNLWAFHTHCPRLSSKVSIITKIRRQGLVNPLLVSGQTTSQTTTLYLTACSGFIY